MSTISRLCAWFERQCVDDWHEDHGIKIDTLDNPGWSLKVDLRGTALEKEVFQDVKVEKSDCDWFVARKRGEIFESFGGPKNLDDMIVSFLAWAE
ncbi:immunity 53 family protein [Tahibacter sp.]|uniref:immunity 53 family protein n=1 Tax=Tahibacter sp. TaxID=2056211 RepID=UPI0028C41DD5|nr:immunity 53 family protein [Tahibacter sp.]